MTRTLPLLIVSALLSIATQASGQGDSAPFRYVARVEADGTMRSPKPLFAAVHALAPGSDMRLDGDKQALFIDTPRELTLVELQQIAAGTGFAVLSLERYDRITGERLAQEGGTGTAFPVFVDTGDERADHARYDAAKAAWIAAHPDDYARETGSAANEPQGTKHDAE
jgi:hypothetical protein